jgi:hypothetical protein
MNLNLDALSADEIGTLIQTLTSRATATDKPKAPSVAVKRLDLAVKPEGDFVTFFWSGLCTDRRGKLIGIGPFHAVRVVTSETAAVEFDLRPGVSFIPVDIYEQLDLSTKSPDSLGSLLQDGHARAFQPGTLVRFPPLTEEAARQIANNRVRWIDHASTATAAELELHASLYPKGHAIRKAILKKLEIVRQRLADLERE